MSNSSRVFRPLGLTIAILTGVIAFSIYPIARAYFSWRLNNCTNDAGLSCGVAGFPFDTLTQGIAIVGVVVFITAIFAWVGKPKQIRFIFQGAVILMSFLLLIESIVRTRENEANLSQGELFMDSTRELFNSILQCQIPILILVALYVIWYCNRAPARAFYSQTPMKTYDEFMQESQS